MPLNDAVGIPVRHKNSAKERKRSRDDCSPLIQSHHGVSLKRTKVILPRIARSRTDPFSPPAARPFVAWPYFHVKSKLTALSLLADIPAADRGPMEQSVSLFLFATVKPWPCVPSWPASPIDRPAFLVLFSGVLRGARVFFLPPAATRENKSTSQPVGGARGSNTLKIESTECVGDRRNLARAPSRNWRNEIDRITSLMANSPIR